ncbi:MAG TPA: hypothetical protein VFN38_04990 [Gemmatimonadaceae bacterium]|nr:hypothetical protein [Gemmatimonadaceae bacterium]
MANVATVAEQEAFLEVEDGILKGEDPDLAVRLLLADIQVTCGDEAIRLLSGDRPKLAPPWLAVIDGEEPRLGEQMPLDSTRLWQDIALFLRQAVSLDPAWLDQRVALAWRDQPDLVRRVRRRIEDGGLKTDLARQAPAVVVLEAMRQPYPEQKRLLEILVPPRPHKRRDYGYDCGMAAVVLTPLGARFAAALTKRQPRKGEPERKA